jgi:hypothetical protein
MKKKQVEKKEIIKVAPVRVIPGTRSAPYANAMPLINIWTEDNQHTEVICTSRAINKNGTFAALSVISNTTLADFGGARVIVQHYPVESVNYETEDFWMPVQWEDGTDVVFTGPGTAVLPVCGQPIRMLFDKRTSSLTIENMYGFLK